MVGGGMRSAYRRHILRTIKKSLGRYMAIFAIIALGVGFFAGLKAAKPAMMKTGQEYVDDQKLYDLRLISTWGFTEEEVEDLRELPGVAYAEGALWEDFLYVNEEGEENCLKAFSITDQMNLLTLKAGRMPEHAGECVVDAYRFSESVIGRDITVSRENDRETLDSFTRDTFTVVGLVRSPLYMNMERGTTTIGNGQVDAFIFLPKEAFSYEYLKEVYVGTEQAGESFSEDYDTYMDFWSEELEPQAVSVIAERYEQELADARQEIADAKQELADAKQEIADAKQELADKTAEAEQELADAKQELMDGEAALADARRELTDNEELLAQKKQELADGEAALAEGETLYWQGLSDYQAGYAEYEAGVQQLAQNRSGYEQALAAKAQMESLGFPQEMLMQDSDYLYLVSVIAAYEEGQAQLAETKAILDAAKAQLDGTEAQLAASRAQLEEGRQQLSDGEAALAAGRKEIEASQQKIADGWMEYEDGVKQLEEEVADAEQEIADGEREIADGEEEIADVEEELADVEEPEIFLLGRNTNIGYASYEGDVSIVEGIAMIFPVFFFLIAALVCSTTMTRMVDDERTQIGTLRALGYSEGAILLKYVVYSGSAAVLGATIGYFLGSRLFPMAIWTAYGMLYGFADLIIVDDVFMFLLSLVVSLLCSVGTTYAACRMELRNAPAELIRPKAPHAGKRIFLERITLIWKKMKFLHKVSARNIFRFKKRMIMMILGIAGCTALVVAGFGVKDSIANIVNNQYDKILQYDISASYTREVTENTQERLRKQYGSDILTQAVLLETSADAPYDGGSKSVTLMVSEGETIQECVNFHLGDVASPLPGFGEILIDNRLADALSVSVGDEVTLQSGDIPIGPLRVAGIFENYTFYYAYMSAETYEACFGEVYEPKSLYLSLAEGVDPYEIASYISDMPNAANVSVVADMRARVENTMKSMDYVVFLVIASAAALAFIVLFNLGNINISERVREIATLKVLGFYPRETGAYVFRENVVLSIMGIVFGLPLGVLLHRFVMFQIKIDMVSFEIIIKPISFLYAVLAVLGFTICVDLIMRKKISGIHMAESLKSIE